VTARLLRGWRVVVGVAVLLVVLLGVDPATVGAAVTRADLRLVIIGVLGLTAVHLVSAASWRTIHGRMTGRWLPWREAVPVFYAAQAIGGVTPANLGGDLHRAAVLRGSGQSWGSAVAPLLVQRATSYLALSALAIVASAILAAHAPMAGGLALVGLAVAIGVAGMAWVLVSPPAPLRDLRDRITGGAPDPMRATGPAAIIGIGSGLAFHGAAIGFTAVIALAVVPGAPLLPVLAALATARLALAVPVTPSGLGIQEGILAILFTALGLGSSAALAAMLLARLSLLLTTVIGVVALVRARHHPDAAAADERLPDASLVGR